MSAGTTTSYPSWMPLRPVSRPSRLTPQRVKDSTDAYDNQTSRFWMSGIDSGRRTSYLSEYVANCGMTANLTGASSWGSSQQIRELLGDQNNPTGRNAWKYTVMQPMHTRLVGACASMSINAQAMSWTANKAARLDAILAKRILLASAAELGGPLQEAMQNMHGVQPDAQAEEEQVRNTWTDPYERTVTDFITALSEHQDFEGMKQRIASNIGLSGIGAVAFFEVGNNIESMVIDPAELIYDTSHQKRDMSDSSFMGWCPLMDVETLGEQYQPKAEMIHAIEKWSNMSFTSNGTGNGYGWPERKPRVAKMFYKDIETVQRGFVLVDGMPEYVTIYPEKEAKEETKLDGVPRYTDKDLIEAPVNRWTATWTEDERKAQKQTRYIQKLRYCDSIPWEWMPYGYTRGTVPGSVAWHDRRMQLERDGIDVVSDCGDMVLAHGEYGIQERDPDDVFRVVFPIKACSWLNVGGNIIAPLSCVRDIQGVMNATLADMMMRMSRADMPTTVFDEGALAGANVKQEEAAANLKIGKAFAIQSQLVGGINQAITTTETGLGADFYNRFSILDHLYSMAQNATGFYDQNFGAPGQDQLVRVKEMQDRQSGIMMQPLLACNESIFMQMHQYNSMAGRQFYSQRPWLLNRFVGDEGERILMESQDMMDEEFRVKVVASASPEQRRELARTMLISQGGYVDRQWVDAQVATELLASGAMPEDVDDAAARFTKRMAEAQQQAQQQQQEQQAMMAAGQQMQSLNEQEQKLSEHQGTLALGEKKAQLGAMKPIIESQAAWLHPQEGEASDQQQAA